MTTVFVSLSMSLDGFTAGPDDGAAHPRGVGGERLHARMADDEAEIATGMFTRSGAVVTGRRVFDIGRAVWGGNAFAPLPMFVVTSRGPDPGDEGWGTFVAGGLDVALEQARAVAGDRDIWVSGGASVVRQGLAAGLLDELQITLVPTLLGSGMRLFDGLTEIGVALAPASVVESRAATHLRYRVVTSPETRLT